MSASETLESLNLAEWRRKKVSILLQRNRWHSSTDPSMCSSILTASSCVSSFFHYILTPFLYPPQCPVKPLSHLFLPQCCRTKPSKLSLRCPCPPNPSSPTSSTDYSSPSSDEKSHNVYGSFLLDGFQIPPLFFPRLCFIFFSLPLPLSVCLSVVDEVNGVGQEDVRLEDGGAGPE